ncbi:hypothetical protein DEO72_LG8g1454 [Vigna unguiculata]|uniref:Uncharacterized protein n=1 Tax=Vigna unguiculata TaxID=3917 RepID=A0A4D6MPG9_VIGUN|nr:hypothetical protein DEO72_LG8g1454 [Vigna unguiculata]
MNRLVAMSFCQAARHWLRSVWQEEWEGMVKDEKIHELWIQYRSVVDEQPTKLSAKLQNVSGIAPNGLLIIARRASAWRWEGTARRSGFVSPSGAGYCASGEAHIQLLSRGDTSEIGSYVPCSRSRDATCEEVRGWWITCVGLRAGSSPFLFVYGDDRVIRYSGADVDIGGAEDVQAME